MYKYTSLQYILKRVITLVLFYLTIALFKMQFAYFMFGFFFLLLMYEKKNLSDFKDGHRNCFKIYSIILMEQEKILLILTRNLWYSFQ